MVGICFFCLVGVFTCTRTTETRNENMSNLEGPSMCVRLADLGSGHEIQSEIAQQDDPRRGNPPSSSRELGLARAKKGLVHLTNQRFQQALTEFAAAIDLGYDTPAVYFNRGAAFEGLGKFDEAITDYDRGVAMGLRGVYLARGRTYWRKGAFELAIQDLTKAAEEDKDKSTALFLRATAYANLNYFQAALRDYDLVIKMDPDDSESYLRRGVLYLNVFRDHGKAISDFDECIRLDAAETEAYLGKAIALHRLGKHDEHDKVLKKAQTVNPKEPRILFRIGMLSVENGRTEDAISYLEKALQLEETNKIPGPPEGRHFFHSQVLFVLGRAYKLQKNADKSKTCLEAALKESTRAIDIQPYNVQSYEIRAQMLRALGRVAEAEKDEAKVKKEGEKIRIIPK